MTADWYLMRATGIVALLLLTAAIVLGVAAHSRWRPNPHGRSVVRDLHRNLGLLAAVFVTIHVVTAVVHPDAAVGLVDVLVPFLTPSHPLTIGFGTVVIDLLAAILVTTALRRHIGRRAWRAVHLSAWALWPVAMMHALPLATDLTTWWFAMAATGSTFAIVAAATWRSDLAQA